MPKKINITETVLRDANQSLCATRIPIEDFVDILETMDQAGYYSVECWGGATFDSCLRYLNEDPWERLRTIRKHMPNTKLQMLLRGQNILGYRHYSDEAVRGFVRKAVENGIDIIRIFDALNDLRNIEVAVDECLKAGAEAQGVMCYTKSPVHTLEKYVEQAKELERMGCQSLCIKDMAALLSPKEAYDLVKALKENCSLKVVVHTHDTTGLGSMTLLKAVEAGADVIDCAISPFASGTAQPCTESMSYALKQFGYDTGLKEDVLTKIKTHFAPVKKKFLENGQINPYVMATNADGLIYQVPRGMLSNLIANLTDMNSMDKFDEVLAEIPKVRKDMGYPPLVTPLSQMVGSQATVNVIVGERYKNFPKEIVSYLRGEYGRAPGEINQEIVKMALGDEKPMTERIHVPNELPEARIKAAEIIGCKPEDVSEEDVLSYVAFPKQAEDFFRYREEHKGVKVTYAIQKVEE